MRVLVAGNIEQPLLLDTSEATAILIETDDGAPTVIFKMLDDGRGWIRLVKGEDKNFDAAAKELELV